MIINSLIGLLLITNTYCMACNFYPLNEMACIQNTTDISCQFNFFENACTETKSTNHGCVPNLNFNACLSQMTNIDGTEAYCIFSKKCRKVNRSHLKMLDCDQNFSFSACMNLIGKKCAWINNKCSFQEDIPDGENCTQVFQSPVSPSLCARIPGLRCHNNGFLGGYTCSDVTDKQLTELKCDAIGLSEAACISILTDGQLCLFQDYKCQPYINQKIVSCQLFYNKNLCLNITDPSILCQWSHGECVNLNPNLISDCEGLSNVNPSVCAKANGLCQYNQLNNSCQIIEDSTNLNCDNKGLSKETCMKIQKEKCIFANGQCKSMADEELFLLDCEQVLNELACINIQTPFQYCKWDGIKCSKIFINQNVDCTLIKGNKVNGNTCQAISKYNQGCKYNPQNNLCQANSPTTDSCTTSFLNLSGCVQVASNIACKWNSETFSCQVTKVIDKLTKCNDLGFANPIACSQVSEPTKIQNGELIKLGCYYNQDTQTCTQTDEKVLKTMECSQPGLNKYGCTQIIKLGQRCRWVRGVCTNIARKELLTLTPCLDLQFVNPGTCALVTANSEVCKYNSLVMGCINILNTSIDGDSCNTPGLNSFACSQITRDSSGCYFDKVNNLCVLAPSSTSSDVAEQYASAQLLSTAQCVASSPTKNICISIQTYGQLCSWNSRSSQCENQYIEFNEECLDYNTSQKQKKVTGAQINVNANVCASILMNFPDYNSKSQNQTTDALRGYCQYDGKGNCIIFAQKSCTDKCCSSIVGINAHVCSRFSKATVYCYFNENNKCVELTNADTDISNVSSVKAFYNYKQYKCSSMNKKSCTMIEWSTKQQCFWNGNVCTQVNYNDYLDFNKFSGKNMSKYGCLGIQANKGNQARYFKYNNDGECAVDILNMSQCNQYLANQNKCLGQTPNIYCQWDKTNLQCVQLDNYLNLKTCNEYQNKQACIDNPYVPCLFLDSADKCMPSPSEVNCGDFGDINNDYYGWVNKKACSNITKAGQICKYGGLYNCQNYTPDQSKSCDLPGINSIGCYSKTTGNCRWDSEQLFCYEVDSSVIDTLKCTDNVNQQICLSITLYPCEWSTTNLKCSTKANFNSLNSSNQFNAQTCTQMTGDAYYYDEDNKVCKKLTTINNDCTTQILNQQACLLNTQGKKCYFDQNQVPKYKCQQFTQEQEVCSSNLLINIEICMNIPQTCYFDESTLTCLSTTLNSQMKCSSLISTTKHFNKLSCSSISLSITDSSSDNTLKVCTDDPIKDAAQQCYFEKYCYWEEKVYGCKLYRIVDATFRSGNTITCSLQRVCIPSCFPIYSAAVCLQFGVGCFFDISQGGCKEYAANTYKVSDCSQINGNQCTDSKTTTAYCKKQLLETGTYLTMGCSIDPLITSTCITDNNFNKSACSTLSSSKASDCALASDDCFFKSTCTIPNSSDKITCTTPGVSQSLCLSLSPPCDFSSGQCTDLTIPSQDSNNHYYVCQEVNLLTTNYPDIACASIKTSPCKYQSFACGNAFYQTCSSLSDLKVSQLACTQCSGSSSVYNPDTYQCETVTSLTSDCDKIIKEADCELVAKHCQWDSDNEICQINALRLNEMSCLQLTSSIMAKWDSSINQCITLTSSKVIQETDCTIQSIKSCLQIKNTCWISDSHQCVQLTSLNKSCLEINEASGSQNQCLISTQEACKWKDSKCQSADLKSDDCSNMNKYGCINIQKNVTCGWSNLDKKCKQINLVNSLGCAQYVLDNDKNYYQVNRYTCSQILQGNCYWNDVTNKCISVGTTTLSCSKNIGLNQNACLQSTEGKCKFDTNSSTCAEITSSDSACSSLMNMEACLYVNYCQFVNNQCKEFPYKEKIYISYASQIPDNGAVISPLICTYYNNNLKDAFFIYDEKRKYCLNADQGRLPSLNFAQCSSIGVNEAICKQKTNQYCQYVNSQCTQITLAQINSQTTCNSTMNWKSCLKLSANCKFTGGQCVPVATTDTCASLSFDPLAQITVYVPPKICAQMSSACKYNSLTFSCQTLSDLDKTQQCSTEGISHLGCLKYTSQSLCYFDAINNICTDYFDRNLSCLDTKTKQTWFINQNLCYFVDSVGSYCYFNDSGQCQQLAYEQVKTCYKQQTNARTCSKAQDKICFYVSTSKTCSDALLDLNSQPWESNSSFTKLACLNYNNPNDPRKTIWDDIKGCLELSTADLANIQCSSPVNKLACVSITNPTQFCKYTDKCVGYDYIIPPVVPITACSTLTNVNRLEFCQYAPDSCQFNSFTKNCILATITDEYIITETDCFDKGLSKIACTGLTICKYSDARKLCYGGNVFCSDNTPEKCKEVQTEPCWIQNNVCKGISYTDLAQVGCSDVINKLGCTSITTPAVVCQFDEINLICQEITNFTNNCSSYTNVNNAQACEQTIDVACKFDYSSKACKAVQYSDVFECDRGLNELACTGYTRSSLGCKFGKFCYGPTYGVTQCSDIINIATCMNYKFKCTWDTTQKICSDFTMNGQTCLDLQNSKIVVSSQVCYSSQVDQGVCLYDHDSNNCKFTIAKTCQELETQQQCISQASLPCLWFNSRCSFVTLISTDLCSYIGENGTKRACMDVFRQGEQCQYKDNKCQEFVELTDGSSNCLDSINLIACTQQLRSQCQWKITTTTVMINQKDEKSYDSGVCVDYATDEEQSCDKSLSYLSCFTITKSGQFCRWQNGQCMSIPKQLSTTKIFYNTFTLINSNSCGLVNQGKVQYSEVTKSCILINQSTLTCKCGQETPGMNKYACLSILNENCIWDDVIKRCLEHQSVCHNKGNNRLLTTVNYCFIENAKPEDCQSIQIQKPCGYVDGVCIEIDLDKIECDSLGINKFACQNTKSQRCHWNSEMTLCELSVPQISNHGDIQFEIKSLKENLRNLMLAYLIMLIAE